jgi:hypothetical protein
MQDLKMNKWEWTIKLKGGGNWLGTARDYLQRRAIGGDRLIWGSFEEVRGLTVKDIEDMALSIAAAALAEYEKSIIKDHERNTTLPTG